LDGLQQHFQQTLREGLFATPIVDRLGDLITEGADPRRPIKEAEFGNSLQAAAYHGSEDIVEFLLSEKIPTEKRVNGTEHSKIMTLYHTYKRTFLFIYLFLGGGYGTALQAASANGQLKLVQWLLTRNNKDLNVVGECVNVNGLDS